MFNKRVVNDAKMKINRSKSNMERGKILIKTDGDN